MSTRSRAASKSIRWICLAPRRTANRAASLTRLARSAPLMPGRAPGHDRRGRRRGPSACPCSAPPGSARRSSRSGRGTTIWRSKRPGRSSAGSRMSGRLVAAIIDDALGRLEAVHLGQHLVEGLLPLVVAAAEAGAALAADRVDLVDEDDGPALLAGRLEQVADPARADADEHLHEVRAGDRQEGTPASPATARASRVLPVPGGPTSRTPLGIRAPISLNRSGIRRKSTTSLISSLTPVVAGHVGEGRARPVGRVHLGPAAPDRHDVAHLALRPGAASR